MIFALYRLAGEVRGLNGCRPKWVHLLSESDVPVRPCPAVHQLLAWHPGVSRISLFRDDGGPSVVEWFGSYYPIGHTDEWTTLALPHALALADVTQQEKLHDKWTAVYLPGKDVAAYLGEWACPFWHRGNCGCALLAPLRVGLLSAAGATRLPAVSPPRGETSTGSLARARCVTLGI